VLGLLVGIFYAIKNYMASTLENIHNKTLKVTMVLITCLSAVAILMGVFVFAKAIAAKRILVEIESQRTNGISYAVRGDYNMAIEEFTKAINASKADTTLIVLYELRGRALIAKSSSESVTLLDREFKDIAVARPKEVPRGTVGRAIDDFSAAIKLDSKNPVYYRERGRAYNWMDNDDKAIEDFSVAIGLNPNYAVVYNSRGILRARKDEDVLAIEDYTKAIELDPKFIYAYRNRGGVYAKNNDFNKAIADFEAALRIDPNNADAKWSLKQVRDNQRAYKKQGRGRTQ
jgi:tetratricopeptide (TPR) repeat protein